MPEAYQIKVVVPCNASATGSATLDEIRDEINERMAERAGGFTTYRDARGGWVADDGNLITEPVYAHTCVYVPDERHGDGEIEARAFARELAEIVQFCTDEDATLFTVTPTYMDIVE